MNSNSFRQLRLREHGSGGRRGGIRQTFRSGFPDSSPESSTASARGAVNDELTPRESVVMMLHTAAEIEHSLLVQYLYAAYSIRLGMPIPGVVGRTTTDWYILLTPARRMARCAHNFSSFAA
jgi:hypothetical protein